MAVEAPAVDKRRYPELLNEALARIPVHTPEWTNYGPSDPGRTLVELFCFLAENMLFQANQIPARNRSKFLELLGVPLQRGSPASGIVVFANERGPLRTEMLNADLQVEAGNVPFQTEHAIDVLPLEARVYYKRKLEVPAPRVEEYYKLLYASYRGTATDAGFKLDMYETVPLPKDDPDGIDLGAEAVDASLWIALLVRAADKPPAPETDQGWDQLRKDVCKEIGGKTLSLGVAPALLDDQGRRLAVAAASSAEARPLLRYEFPNVPPKGKLPDKPALRVAEYREVDARPLSERARDDVLTTPGVVGIPLPAATELRLWSNIDPLEAGVGEFPPALDDSALERRVITWLRVRAAAGTQVRLVWVDINAAKVTQRARVFNELLGNGTGLPDQERVLSSKPVVRGSCRVEVTLGAAKPEIWREADDLLMAGPEVDVPDPSLPPGHKRKALDDPKVFALEHATGRIRFGDGLRGKRPPEGAFLRATYDYSLGAAGNLGEDMIKGGSALPAGFTVKNALRTWGGADAESVAQAEKGIARYIQHRDRLVTAADFAAIARRAPGVDIGRLEVLPAFHPELSPNMPGDAPGAVTLLVIPRHDPMQPGAPRPDRPFLDALCRYLDQRRLVTTEVVLRGPEYVPIWVSIGIEVKAGHAVPAVREAVKARLLKFLAPLGQDDGWPLRKAVDARELSAEASRVEGVLLVNGVEVARGSDTPSSPIGMTGLQLPRVLGISVAVGEAPPIDALRGQPSDALPEALARIVPVPAVPEKC
jgi:hypothetical protein